MAALESLGDYGSESNSDSGSESMDFQAHLKPLGDGGTIASLQNKMTVNSAPIVVANTKSLLGAPLDSTTREVTYNPKYEDLFAPEVGPQHPFKTKQQLAEKNILSGYVEPAHVNDFTFERERRTFTSYGYAIDPSHDASLSSTKLVGNMVELEKNKGATVFECKMKREGDKRKKETARDPSDIDSYLGPWAKYADEKTTMKPTEEEQEELDEIVAKRQKKGKSGTEKSVEEKSTLHIKDALDYQGRSFLHAPQDVGVNLRSEDPPDKCYMPKKLVHTWSGHTRALSAIRWLPHTAHLLLSCGMDAKVKVWEVYNERRCLRTYLGHKQAVRDIAFNNDGSRFLSAGYDRYIKLWDTETGECISKFTSRKVPYCVKFNPDEDKQHLFVAGTSDKKIVCVWDITPAR
ncbi:PREDICTED: pre-mRNA-processing factor 17-like [Priapulus caudatus]|uniref:Pre-mRNA-processing factor 17-like n=1 Tax=Priapulus caudatus TaxID=37621 RepID=A0ABM1F3Z8_PRICU|nr:PREDICTED: pre-mRNA-processing factor 17-like [Priapulus caudatus]